MSNQSDGIVTPETILAFWREAGPDKWFTRDDDFDADIRQKFLPTYEAAAAGKLADWERTAEGTLALLIVLDQFPRNMFRGDARCYASDELARGVAHRALKRMTSALLAGAITGAGVEGEVEILARLHAIRQRYVLDVDAPPRMRSRYARVSSR